MRLRPIATACVLAVLTLLLYAFRLSAPAPGAAELIFNSQAQAIRAGHTPLFFHVRDEHWLQPIAPYANAAVRAIGGDDLSGRLASAAAAAVGVALVFLIAYDITGRAWPGVLAALTLLLTPAYWSFAQRGTDAIMPVPLLLLWLWNLLRFVKADAPGTLVAAAALLGLSIYSHPAAPLTAVFLWTLTLVVTRRRNRVRLFAATAVFGAAWLPALAWFVRHFDTYPDTFGRWFVLAAHLRNPLDGLRAFINPGTVGNRASMYWGFWDPSWLFFATREAAAPLLMIAAPLLALGVVRCVRHLPRETATILIGAALLAPLAGATFGVPHYMADAAVVLPILALLVAVGAEQLVRLVRRRPLEDGVAVSPVDGWDDYDVAPQSRGN